MSMLTAGLKGQSAIEFLSTYAFMFLIIAVAVLLLFMYFSLPKNILPSACNFYSGFNCADAVYANTSTGSELLIVATDMMPGIVNTSSFGAYLGYINSTSGYCAPSFAIAGQEMYCIAYFNSKAVLGRSYGGTFHIKANYCAAGAASIYNASCSASSNFTYSGYLTVSASVLPTSSVSNTYYVPINITNSQQGAVPAHFQQMIQFAPSTYATYERPDLGNIRFYYGDKELYSWCEANCMSSSASNAIFWVKLPVAIPPNQNRVIDMYFLPYSVDYDGVYAGEAPQLSPVYGEYDNGANVFLAYWGFEGKSLPQSLTQYASSGATVTVNDGLTVSTGSGSWGGIVSTLNYTTPVISEAYVALQSGGALSGGIAQQTGPLPSSPGYDFNGWSGSIGEGSLSGGMSGTQNINLQIAVPGENGQTWTAQNSQTYYKGYLASTASSTDLSFPGSIYVSAGVYCCSGGDTITYDWLRVREYPPNGMMPGTSFGSITAS
ncbi:MAG: hypothetical protein M1360_03985 [Candidatus Marsarchaeota archaeon]|nr:hypothetical protein [Candidatus Marsarchaeota archaeon]MCL5419070.1 hypothetical protein [Candidatus Marsarchaeota archaeon]